MNTNWAEEFSEHVRTAMATQEKSNVRVVLAGPYSVTKFYKRPVNLPGNGPKTKLMAMSQNTIQPVRSSLTEHSPLTHDSAKTTAPRTPEQNQRRYASKRTNKMSSLIDHNFDPRTAQLVTLTFEKKQEQFQQVKKSCQAFFKRLVKNVPGVKYMAVPEQHADQSWHVHLIVDRELPLTAEKARWFIDQGVIKGKKGSWEFLWKLGHVNQKSLDNGGKLGVSIARYITKSWKTKEMKGSHKSWQSRNLDQPTTIYGQEAVDYVRSLDAVGEKPLYGYCCNQLKYVESLTVFEFCHDREAALVDKQWKKPKTWRKNLT